MYLELGHGADGSDVSDPGELVGVVRLVRLVRLVRPPGRRRSEGLVEMMVERLHWSWHVWLLVGGPRVRLCGIWEPQLIGLLSFAA